MTSANIIPFGQSWQAPDLTFMTGAGSLSEVPQFPLDVLGTFWSDFIVSAAGAKLPRDFFALNVLGTTSGLIGNGLEAVMPAPSSVREPATLWMINVGPPGMGKTPAFTPFVEAVDALEIAYDVTRKVEDTTIAGLIKIAAKTPEGLVVMNDELSGWWDNFKRDRGGEQFWLKAWNGKLSHTHHRGGRGGEATHVPRLNVAVLGGAQPATLPTMLKATGDVERGFVSRCLFSYPDPVAKEQEGTGTPPDVAGAQQVLARLFGLASKGLRSVPVTEDAAAYHGEWVSRFNPEALWLDNTKPEGQWVAKQYGTAIRLALVLETLWWAAAKAPSNRVLTQAQKLAALADPSRNGSGPERASAQRKLDALIDKHGLAPDGTWQQPQNGPATITLKAIRAACDLIEQYFHPHFVRCEGSAYVPPHIKAAKDLTLTLIKNGASSFNARRLQKYEEFGKVSAALHGSGSGDIIEEVCDYLEERNLIRLRASRKVGRKAKDYDVNPALVTTAKKVLR